jgi:hypothetical protein
MLRALARRDGRVRFSSQVPLTPPSRKVDMYGVANHTRRIAVAAVPRTGAGQLDDSRRAARPTCLGGTTFVTHAHLPIRHLIRQVEIRSLRPQRDTRPQWMAGFVDSIAELFEPFTDMGRVGFECRASTEDRWEITMYLGRNEVVGGRLDGRRVPVDFQFDLHRACEIFETVTSVRWNVFGSDESFGEDAGRAAEAGSPSAEHVMPQGPVAGERSYLMIDGTHAGACVRLKVFSTPPADAGPGLRMHHDGTWDAT